MLINIKNNNFIIILISLYCLIEFIISPEPFYSKVNNSDISISLVNLTFDISELLIYFFIGISLVFYTKKFLFTSKISLGYGYNKYLVLSFILPLIASIVVGYIEQGPEFMTMIRVQVILLLFIVFMNMYDVKKIIHKVIKIIFIIGIINVIISFLSFIGIDAWKITIYPDFSVYSENMWFGLYLSMFSYSILLNKIFIEKKFFFIDYLLLILIIVVVIINITNKPIFLSMIVITFTTFGIFFRAKIKRYKILIIGLCIFILPFFIYLNLDDKQKVLFIYTVSQRFLKQEAYTWDEVIDNLSTVDTSGGKDLSAGRFELWKSYIVGVADTPIVSSNYGYKNMTKLSAMGDKEFDFAAHNSIAHYTYYAGYISGISLALIICYFIKTTFNYRNRLLYVVISKKYSVNEYQFHAILSFIYAIIVNELVGGPLMNAKFSWFWWILVVFVLKIISESREKKNV